jgi:hypothetical protein
LALGAVLRLKKWEDQGIFIHFEAGLPDSTKLWVDLLTLIFKNAVADIQVFAVGLSAWVLELATTRLAWNGMRLIGADMVLGDLDEDSSVEAIAQFLWANRHGGK